MHIGSQLLDAEPYAAGVRRLLDLVAQFRDAGVDTLATLDIGGGLGIRYRDERPLESGVAGRRGGAAACGTAGCHW